MEVCHCVQEAGDLHRETGPLRRRLCSGQGECAPSPLDPVECVHFCSDQCLCVSAAGGDVSDGDRGQ